MAGKKSWLSVLIKEADEPVQNQPTATAPINNGAFQARYAAQPGVAVNQPIPMAPVMVADTDTPDQAYLDHLYKFMEEQNIPGPDYFEYANTLHEMGQMASGIPEANLFQLAYVGLKAQDTSTSCSDSYKVY